MKVRVVVRSHQFDISVGNGSQSFQWLASVIESRLKQQNILRKSLEDDSFIVTEIRNASNELINPRDKIYEHAGPTGLNVSATVATQFPVDDWENAQRNDWMLAAHMHSSAGQHWAREIDAWRVSLEQVKSSAGGVGDIESFNAALMTQRVMPQSAQFVKIGFDFTEADVELAFNLDWQAMQWKWLRPNELLRSKLGQVMKAHYALVCNVFTHFAGMGKVGQRYGMTIEEFGHFLHMMRLFDWKKEEEDVEDLFFKTSFEPEAERKKASANSSSGRSFHASKDQPGDKWPLMTRAHFAEAIVAAALHKQLGESADAAVGELFADSMTTFWDEISSKYLLYSCTDPALKDSYEDFVVLLKLTFQQRASIDSKFGPRLPATEFMSMMRDSTLVDVEQETVCIGCFLQAQLNPPVHMELECLVFAEFVEALCRISLKVIEGLSLNEAKRMRMGFSLVIEQTVGEDAHK